MSTLSVAGRARIAAAPLSAEARTRYGDAPAAATVQRLADLLDSPVRITVSGPRGCGTTTLAEALRSAFRLRPGGTPARTSFSESPAVAPLVAGDAPIVLLSSAGTSEIPPEDPLGRQPALTVGVLTRIDEMGAIEPTGAAMTVARRMAAVYGGSPDVGRRCSVVLPVAGQLARAAAALDDADLDVLRTVARRSGPVPDDTASPRPTPRRRGQPDDDPTVDLPGAEVGVEVEGRLRRRLGAAGVGLAVALIRTGQAPTVAALAAALTRSSGMQELVEQLDRRLVSRALSTGLMSGLSPSSWPPCTPSRPCRSPCWGTGERASPRSCASCPIASSIWRSSPGTARD